MGIMRTVKSMQVANFGICLEAQIACECSTCSGTILKPWNLHNRELNIIAFRLQKITLLGVIFWSPSQANIKQEGAKTMAKG